MSPIRPAATPVKSKFGASGAPATQPTLTASAPSPAPARTLTPPARMPGSFGASIPQTAPFQPPIQTAFAPLPIQQSQPAQVQEVDIFDIPDPEFNPEIEQVETVAPPPPDDGDHLCEVVMSERNPDPRPIEWDQKTKEGTVHHGAVGMSLVATLNGENDPFYGRRVFLEINSFTKRGVGREGTSNDIAVILRALGEVPTGKPKSDAYRVKELLPATIIVETQWHAQFPYDPENPKKNKRPYKVGQENFPKDEVTGTPQPLYETPAGDPLRTIAVPVGFKRAVA